MRYFGIVSPGQERDKDMYKCIKSILCELGNRVLFASKEDCIAATQKIEEIVKGKYTALKCEWLNDWDNDKQESVVFCISRSLTMPYAIGYIHFYKVREA